MLARGDIDDAMPEFVGDERDRAGLFGRKFASVSRMRSMYVPAPSRAIGNLPLHPFRSGVSMSYRRPRWAYRKTSDQTSAYFRFPGFNSLPEEATVSIFSAKNRLIKDEFHVQATVESATLKLETTSSDRKNFQARQTLFSVPLALICNQL